ncbi:MAG: glycosyltransferase [Saprospiraceae bacterium]|nr:glycosyltransferase [Saprospiraceae bacterium]
MNNSFISVITVLHSPHELRQLPGMLNAIHPVLQQHFADFEIILVNNGIHETLTEFIDPLPDALKHNIFLVKLSNQTIRNHAILAGLDRSNGDYTVLFEQAFTHKPEIILELYNKSREGYDIVYLRAINKKRKTGLGLFYRIFYYILRHYSDLKIDENAHNTRIISRRALNSILRLRENLRYMKAIYSMVGYQTIHIEVPEQVEPAVEENLGDRFKTSLIAITSYTTFLRSLLLGIFIFSSLFLVMVVVNALKVKFTGIDLFGNVGQAVDGWTFLVILIAVFFAITCLNLYIISIYLSNIYAEIKQRPLYIIESVKRF